MVFKKGYVPWNKGKKGSIPWNKGLTREMDKRIAQPWNTGLTKKTNGRLKKMSDIYKGMTSPMKGKHHTKEAKELLRIANVGKHCSEECKINMSKSRMGYKHTGQAKEKMRNSTIERIERQKFNGLPMMPCISNYEKPILDNLEKCFGYTILRQHKVSGYFLDGYCPMLNLAVEIDEKRHRKEKQIIKDRYREDMIKKELGCQFLRIPIGDDLYGNI